MIVEILYTLGVQLLVHNHHRDTESTERNAQLFSLCPLCLCSDSIVQY